MSNRAATSETVYLYLSPHLDDAVLSAGGLLQAQARSGARVWVASFCTADPPADHPLSALARRFHESWGSGSPYAERRSEDRAALDALGARVRHLPLLDAIYRSGRGGPGEYRAPDELFAPPAAWDAEFTGLVAQALRRLLEELDPARVYGPLAVGSNVDHQHVRAGLWQLREELRAPLWLYEDQPYSAGIYPRTRADPVLPAVRGCPFALEPEVHAIDFAAKAAAIRGYRSQLAELFGEDLAGLSELETYHRGLLPSAEPAERVWRALGIGTPRD